jgi:hypothetical protein
VKPLVGVGDALKQGDQQPLVLGRQVVTNLTLMLAHHLLEPMQQSDASVGELERMRAPVVGLRCANDQAARLESVDQRHHGG